LRFILDALRQLGQIRLSCGNHKARKLRNKLDAELQLEKTRFDEAQ
jgi:hypothetical protein